MNRTILFIASMDTKQNEILLATELARKKKCRFCIMDVSTKELSLDIGDIGPVTLLNAIGISMAEFEQMDKGKRISRMSGAVKQYVKKMYKEKMFDGVMSIGGGQNTNIAANAMKSLPYGVPKLIVSTLASGNRRFDAYIGDKDILIMHSVVDIAGINSFTKMIINNAVAAMAGMLETGMGLSENNNQIRISTTLLGVTTEGVLPIINQLSEEGYDVIGFHANGVGGRAMEELIDASYFDLVLDLTLHEITGELFGGYCAGADDRVLAAAENGTSQIVVPGAIDICDFEVTPENKNILLKKFESRQYYFHNPELLHVKISAKEAVTLGEVIASRLNKAKGVLKVIIPLGGFCEAGALERELYNPEIDTLFIQTLKENLDSQIEIIEVKANINDRVFVEVILQETKKMIKTEAEKKIRNNGR